LIVGLYYYDVNSLYPHAALNPMPGSNCVFEDSINSYLKDVTNFFGFYYCSIKTNNSYLGLLPIRSKQGIIMPNGEWSGWYFSEELRFAALNGYEIFVHKGYSFDKQDNVFYSYVKYFYNIKSSTTSVVEKAISKSLLNNLLGRFGLNIHKSKTELMDMDRYNEISQTKSINSVTHINDKVLVNYNNKVSSFICDELNVDYKNSVIKNLKDNNESEKTFRDVSIAIASAVTSYARISISKTKLHILKNGGELYYSDTDSIVTNIPLEDKLVGNALGQYKLEYIIKEAYFISSKTYCLLLKFGTPVIKAKGVNNHKLSEQDFINLYKGEKVETVRTEAYRDFSQGFVNINIVKPIILNGDAYAKRLKIFRDGIWVDTKPLIIGNIDIPSKNEIISTVKIDKKKKKILDNHNKTNVSKLSDILIYLVCLLSLIFYFVDKLVTFEDDDLCDIPNSELNDKSVDDITDIEKDLNTTPPPEKNPSFYSFTESDTSTTPLDWESSTDNIAKENEEGQELNPNDFDIKPDTQFKGETLYQNFIKDLDTMRANSPTETASTTTTLYEPTPTTDKPISPDDEEKGLEKDMFSPFTPNSLEQLKKEIERNVENMNELDTVCKDPDIKDNVKEKLIDERTYFLNQQVKHMDAIVQQARRVDFGDVDTIDF